jgi:hypothetical protein
MCAIRVGIDEGVAKWNEELKKLDEVPNIQRYITEIENSKEVTGGFYPHVVNRYSAKNWLIGGYHISGQCPLTALKRNCGSFLYPSIGLSETEFVTQIFLYQYIHIQVLATLLRCLLTFKEDKSLHSITFFTGRRDCHIREFAMKSGNCEFGTLSKWLDMFCCKQNVD